MSWREWIVRMRGSMRRRALDQEMDDEVRFHIENATARNLRAGLTPAEARRHALLAFGSAAAVREEARDALRARTLENLVADLRYALRTLWKSRSFAAVTIATLALGAGGTATVYAALRVLLVEPLPFRSADELVLVRGKNVARGFDVLPASYPDYEDWRASGVFEELAAWTSYPGSAAALQEGAGAPQEVQLAYVSANFFQTLGVTALIGQAFLPEDGREGGTPTVVMGHALWQRRFGGDMGIVGGTVSLEGKSFTVRGVLPATFRFAAYPRDAELYVPLAHEPNPGRQRSRGTRYLGTVGRLASGINLPTAQVQLTRLAVRIEDENPVNEGYTVAVAPLREVLLGDRRTSLELLAGGCVVLLLIAALNVANLFLARAASRSPELVVRHALGGGRRRLAALFIAEGLVLSTAGATLGSVLAVVGTAMLAPFLRRAPSYFVPFDLAGHGIALHSSAAIVALGVALGAGALAALSTMPQIRAGLERVRGLPTSRGTESFGAVRTRRRLVTLETALATVLLVAAGVLGRSLWALRTTDPGFRPAGLFAADVRLSAARYDDPASIDAFWNMTLERLRAVDGDAAAVEVLPLSGADQSTGLLIEDVALGPPAERPQVHHRVVSPGYFRLMAVPLLAGRDFRAADTDDGNRVVMINATLARRLFPNGDALGRRISLDFEAMVFRPDGPPDFDPERGYRTIVGVVADVRSLGLDEGPRPELFTPLTGASPTTLTLVFRSRSGRSALQDVRQAVAAADPGQPVGRLVSVPAVVAASAAAPTSRTIVLGTFAMTALLLTAVGIYGMVSFSVNRRRRDLGIRIALGASGGEVRRQIFGEAIRPVLLALAPGLFGGWLVTRALSGLLYGTAPLDPWTFGVTPLFLLAVACAAAASPARRAAAVDPVEALRRE